MAGLVSSAWVWACLLAVATWPLSAASLRPTAGLDASWQGVLARAPWSGLDYGTRIVFTYGPLGFLTVSPIYATTTAILAFCFKCVLVVAVFALLLGRLRRRLPPAAALAVAFVVGGSVVDPLQAQPELMLAFVLAGAVGRLTAPAATAHGRLGERLRWGSLGFLCAALVLIKVSLIVASTAVLLIALLCSPAPRHALRRRLEAGAIAAVSFAATFAAGWLATGNTLAAVPAFVRSSASVISGYSAAMAITAFGESGYIGASIDLACIVALLTAATRGLPTRSRLGVVLATAVVVWQSLKEAFVRYDGSHVETFLTIAPLLIAVLLPAQPLTTQAVKRISSVGVAALVAASLVAYSVASHVPDHARNPWQAARGFVDDILTLASPSQRAAARAAARVELRRAYAIPAAMVAAASGRSLDVEPGLQNVTWAYPALRFDPLPVIQDYTAYTTSLDRIDAADLASGEAPQYILRQPRVDTIDGRLATMDPPLTQLTIECRYRQVGASQAWQLLVRGADRCGPLRALKTVVTRQGAAVEVPAVTGDRMVVATFAIPVSTGWRLENLLFKAPSECLRTSYGSSHSTWRFIVATAPDPHVIDASPDLGYSEQFAPIRVSALTVAPCGSLPPNPSGKIRLGGPLRVTFSSMTMAPVPG